MRDMIRDFRILDKIGEGGMGEVFLAEDLMLDRKVAIKVLNPLLTSDPQFRERFRMEARLQASLIHPHIVALYSFFEDSGSHCMVMEYAPGQTLRAMLDHNGPIPEDQALAAFLQTLEAVGHAHSKGIIHRDLKPSNIIVDEAGYVKVMDFGIARLVGEKGLTRTGSRLGTVQYMSPEQVKGLKDIDKRTDIYSLGVTLFEMLTGKVPFDSEQESDFAVMDQIVNGDIPDPLEYVPGLSKSTVQFLNGALQKERAQRPGSCDDCRTLLLERREPEKPKRKTGNSVPVLTKTLSTRTKEAEASGVLSMAFSPVADLLACAAMDGSVHLFDLKNNCTHILHGHQTWAKAVAFSTNGQLLASAGSDGEVKLWDLGLGQLLQKVKIPWDFAQSLAFSPSGKQIACGTQSTLILWDPDCKKKKSLLHFGDEAIEAVAYNGDGRLLACCGDNGQLSVCDAGSGDIKASYRIAGKHFCTIAFHGDDTQVLTLGGVNFLRLWDLSGKYDPHDVDLSSGEIVVGAFSGNGRYATAISENAELVVVDVNNMKMVVAAEVFGNVFAAAMSFDGRLLAIGTEVGDVRVFETSKMKNNNRY